MKINAEHAADGLTIAEWGNKLLRMIENLGRLSPSDFLNPFPFFRGIR